ncbi:ferritin heavy chain, oocyte isoform [Nephila pilipes]|uniref:Ferritin n=1 Tax=Nephila pilipes TaxID=299642 RepID=A0A8X6QZM3_NEPPI|nr:ferritin heavy chain, oocyte isoform [Nephila pilipes]
MVWVIGILCMILASVVSVSQFSKNDVKDVPSDRYELYPACTTLLRSQVNVEMHASLVYMSMAAHFDQNGIARKGFSKMFRENSKEEREHAQKFIDYLNLRGSKFTDFNIDMPEKTSWGSAVEALNDAIVLEKEVYNQLHHIHDIADIHCKDSHLMDFLENEFFKEQVESIDSFIRHSAIMAAMSNDNGLAEYLYDKQLKEELDH